MYLLNILIPETVCDSSFGSVMERFVESAVAAAVTFWHNKH